jgi:hypothetical protein
MRKLGVLCVLAVKKVPSRPSTLEEDALDPNRAAATIIERTLRYGNRVELRWLFGRLLTTDRRWSFLFVGLRQMRYNNMAFAKARFCNTVSPCLIHNRVDFFQSSQSPTGLLTHVR